MYMYMHVPCVYIGIQALAATGKPLPTVSEVAEGDQRGPFQHVTVTRSRDHAMLSRAEPEVDLESPYTLAVASPCNVKIGRSLQDE